MVAAWTAANTIESIERHHGLLLFAKPLASVEANCGDGVAEIDNNIARNAMRGCYPEPRNFLLVGGC